MHGKYNLLLAFSQKHKAKCLETRRHLSKANASGLFNSSCCCFTWTSNKGPNKCETHALKNFFKKQKTKRKQLKGPLRTFVTVVTRSPSDLNSTNNHMSGPMFSCNLHIKYRLLFSYLRKHAKYSVFMITVNLQNEKPNYNRKEKILVLGKMNLIIIQVGRQESFLPPNNQSRRSVS